MEDRTVDGRPSPGPPSWQGVLFALWMQKNQMERRQLALQTILRHMRWTRNSSVYTNGEAQRPRSNPVEEVSIRIVDTVRDPDRAATAVVVEAVDGGGRRRGDSLAPVLRRSNSAAFSNRQRASLGSRDTAHVDHWAATWAFMPMPPCDVYLDLLSSDPTARCRSDGLNGPKGGR